MYNVIQIIQHEQKGIIFEIILFGSIISLKAKTQS
jgi:hypothetical protein